MAASKSYTSDRIAAFCHRVFDDPERNPGRRLSTAVLANQDGANPLFDTAWYAKKYRINPANVVTDYIQNHRKRNPHPLFLSEYYYRNNPDVAASGLTALEHYWTAGYKENRSPSPLLWEAWYKKAYGLSPDQRSLAHYVQLGAAFGYNPSLLFDTDRVARHLAVARHEALFRYVEDRHNWDCEVIDLFNADYFTRALPAGRRLRQAPLIEYELSKELWAAKTCERFDGGLYLHLNPDVAKSGISPLAHYLAYGANENRACNNGDLLNLLDKTDREYNTHAANTANSGCRFAADDAWMYRPTVSFLVPLFATPLRYIQELVDSIGAQRYAEWEICFSVANNLPADTLRYLKDLAGSDKYRFHYCANAPGISENTNHALQLATGEYVALIDHDDYLHRNALYECVKVLNEDPRIDLLYSDKDLVSDVGDIRKRPLFKPDFSPEIMLSANYMTHFNLIRRSMVARIGGWDSETDGAQDWDIFLRCVAAGAKVSHVPQVLYHWREAPTSVSGGIEAKPYAKRGQLRAVQKYLDGSRWKGATASHDMGQFFIDWPACGRNAEIELVFYNSQMDRPFPQFLDKRFKLRVQVLEGELTVRDAARIIEECSADTIVFLDAALGAGKDFLAQLVGPLSNPDISAVSGIVTDADSGKIVEAGYCFDGRKIQPLFRNHDIGHFGWFGGAGWFRNVSLSSFRALAISLSPKLRRASRRYADVSGGSLLLFSRMLCEAGRVMVNPYAHTIGRIQPLFEHAALGSLSDTLFSPRLYIDDDGTFKLKSETREGSEEIVVNYTAEANYWTERFSSAAAGKLTAPKLAAGPRRALFILPAFDTPYYGGVYTILRYADHLMTEREYLVDFFIEAPIDYQSVRRSISRICAKSRRFEVYCASAGDEQKVGKTGYDLGFASLWTTAYRLNAMSNVREKCYFVQDFEPSFYAGGAISALCESTYRMGLKGLCNSYGVYRRFVEAGGAGGYFVPPLDTERFYPRADMRNDHVEKISLFAYARPFNQRNCFETLAKALSKIKALYGTKVDIYTAGARWDPKKHGLDGVVNHLGMLSLDECAAVYRNMDIGLSFMASAHPSYPPLEMMASGVAVAANFNSSNLWFYEPGLNCELFEPQVESVVAAVAGLVDNPEKRVRIQKNAIRTVREKLSTWNEMFQAVDDLVFGKQAPAKLPAAGVLRARPVASREISISADLSAANNYKEPLQ